MKLTIRGKNQEFTFDATTEVIHIGRASENDFVIPVPDFSRKHCILTIKGNYIFIMDLGSKNGVDVDGKRLEPHIQKPLYPNSKIKLANHFQLLLPETVVKDTSTGIRVEDIIPRKR